MTTTATGNYPYDNSTLAAFTSWATAISNALAAFGWVQSTDTGQVVWTATVLTLTQVTTGGVYSYSSFTGPTPRVGMSVIITGFATGANNVTATLTAVSGGSSGTVTVTPVSQTNETHSGSGTTTALASGSGAAYEIWKANDSAAATLPIFLKLQYNQGTSTPSPLVAVGTSSNGTGTITGGAISGPTWPITNFSINEGTSTTFPCFFSGDAGQFRMLMWTNVSVIQLPVILVIERSKDNTGAVTTEYFTVLVAPSNGTAQQQTIVSASLVSPLIQSGWMALDGCATPGTGFWNSTVAAFPVFPILGKCGNPMLGVATCYGADVAEGTTVTIASMYGATHTYVASKQQNISNQAAGGSRTGMAVLVLYE